jgi:hypothetical protein
MSKDKNNKFKRQSPNEVQANRDKKVGTRDERNTQGLQNILFSFEFFDTEQIPPRQTFLEWEREGLLEPFLERLRHLWSMNRVTAQQGKRSPLELYGDFPTNSEFRLPKFTIPKNSQWGTIRYIGHQLHRVAGFMVDNIFYIVFFDKRHRFYILKER